MSCKRYDCLYHPEIWQPYQCDYMLLTGEKRGCKAGCRCKRYKQATSKEKRVIRIKPPVIFFDNYEEVG